MAYTALYRKWRPARFEDVRGQEHIVRTLKNQIISDRVGHAYLFCGTRGTGKTTIAKIMARAVNCEHPVDGSPCNECAVCKSILEGRSVNVAEIDAASNNGVDNIREIRDQVQYSPTEGKYRVYIIDEVHMLSAGAFNALLKTLEEPPAYVIFILATTEANRIPITVLSRCQRYDFRRIGNDVLADQISHLLIAEKVEADEDAVRYVAKAADGSMRDALSLLEQCISFYYGQRLTYEKVLDVLGAVDTQVFSRLLRLIIECNVPGCVSLMDEISAQGRDLSQFVTDFIWYLRNLMLVQTADQSAQALEMTAENYEALREESKMVALPVLMRNIRICSELSNQLKFAVSKRVLIEMAIIKMMQPQMDDDLDSLRVRLDRIEEQISSGNFAQATPVAAQQKASNASEPQPQGSIFDAYFDGGASAGQAPQGNAQTVELSEAEYEDYQKLSADWKKLSRMQSGFLNSILMGTQISYEKAKGLCIVFTNRFYYELMLQQNRMEELRQMINNHYQKEFSISAKLLEAGEAMPRVTRGSHIEGINMEIGVEDD
jgi:DNA polymerase III subunit gamma/tau